MGSGAVHSVPIPLTRLIGRQHELTEGAALLAVSRLLTLTGPGGSGKTRLSIALAAEVDSLFTGGIVWIELASLADPRALAEHIAAAVGVRDYGARPVLEAIVEQLEGDPTLLILDNCEHVVDACAELVEALLRHCPPLSVMATSREALGIEGERTWLVPPLPCPAATAESVDEISRSDAVQLFVERAQANLAGFALTSSNAGAVGAICRRLDGIPLAIELAAARVGVLAPEQIAERLETNFSLLTGGTRKTLARHRTLRETIEWSYRLLTECEQRLLARLSVFAGHFTLESVEQVCTDDRIDQSTVIDVLSGLIEKSMVMRDAQGTEARYRLLETVREFAREALDAEGVRPVFERRHAQRFLALAEGYAPRLFGGPADRALIMAIEADLDEFHAACDWAVGDPSRAEISVRLGTALNWFWFCCGRFREGRRRLTTAISLAADMPALVRGRGLTALGTLAIWQGDFESARQPMEEAVAVLRALDDRPSRAWGVTGLGTVHLGQGRPGEAIALFDEAVATLGPADRTVLSAVIEYWRGLAHQATGNLRMARASFERALAIGRGLNHPAAIAHPLFVLGRLEHLEHRDRVARERQSESLRIFHAMHDRWGEFQVIGAFSELAARARDGVRAVRLAAASEAIRKQIGVQLLHNTAEFTALMNTIRSLVTPELFEAAWLEGMTMGSDDVFNYALAPDSAPPESPAPTATARVPSPPPKTGKDRTPRLKVRALGPLEITRGAKRLDARAWASVKSRELLLLLLSHQNGCTKEEAALALWPEASPAQVRNNFHVTLHRLRKTLGHADWCVSDGDRYRLNPAYEVDFDVATFERDMRSLLTAARREDVTDRLAAALAVYRGDFLEREQIGDWHIERRDALQRQYIEGLTRLGASLSAAGRHGEAADAYRTLVARDNLAEDAYRGLIRSLIEMGERTEARRTYDVLVRLLRTELDAEPEPATKALMKSMGN